MLTSSNTVVASRHVLQKFPTLSIHWTMAKHGSICQLKKNYIDGPRKLQCFTNISGWSNFCYCWLLRQLHRQHVAGINKMLIGSGQHTWVESCDLANKPAPYAAAVYDNACNHPCWPIARNSPILYIRWILVHHTLWTLRCWAPSPCSPSRSRPPWRFLPRVFCRLGHHTCTTNRSVSVYWGPAYGCPWPFPLGSGSHGYLSGLSIRISKTREPFRQWLVSSSVPKIFSVLSDDLKLIF